MIIIFDKKTLSEQVFKLEGSEECYLFVRADWSVPNWIIWSSLNGEKAYIASGSSGHPCPAHSRNGINLRGFKDWLFNNGNGSGRTAEEWTEGDVVLKCSIHDG